MTQSSIDALKCRAGYVNTSNYYNSNSVGTIKGSHSDIHGDAVFERPGGTALTTGLLHMGIKMKA